MSTLMGRKVKKMFRFVMQAEEGGAAAWVLGVY